MAKQFGDAVQYVHNVQELVTNDQGQRVRVTSLKTSNAIVITSSIHEDREQLQLLYLDDSYNRSILSGADVQSAIKTVFAFPLVQVPFQAKPDAPGVPKLPAPAAAQGWKDAEPKVDKDALQIKENLSYLETAPRIVVFGEGKTTCTPGTSNGHPAVVLGPAPVEIGGIAGAYEPDGGNYVRGTAVTPSTVVLEFHGPEGANVLIADVGGLFPLPKAFPEPEAPKQ